VANRRSESGTDPEMSAEPLLPLVRDGGGLPRPLTQAHRHGHTQKQNEPEGDPPGPERLDGPDDRALQLGDSPDKRIVGRGTRVDPQLVPVRPGSGSVGLSGTATAGG
jgi:hypothetical protein